MDLSIRLLHITRPENGFSAIPLCRLAPFPFIKLSKKWAIELKLSGELMRDTLIEQAEQGVDIHDTCWCAIALDSALARGA
jgi:hypothetical protein